MKELVKRLDSYVHLLYAVTMHLLDLLTATTWFVALLALASGTDCHVELSDLVSVLTWCRHLDWTSPVEVEMTQGVGQLLDLRLGEI